MGNNVMRGKIPRTDDKIRTSRLNCHGCQSCGNRRERRPGSPIRGADHPTNPSHRTITAPRIGGVRTAAQNRSRVPSAVGARAPSSTPRRPKRVGPPPHICRTHIPNKFRRRRHRTRPRSRPNTQSGGPVGGDLAVPGDQPTSPQPPDRNQAEDAAERVRQDVCLPVTSTATVTPSDACQRVIPTRWAFLRRNVRRPSDSELDLRRCASINTGLSTVQSSAKVSSEVSVGTGMKRFNGTPMDDVPRMQTGFYFGTSNRRSWPHSGASAEYFTAVSNRRIKKLEPSLKSEEITFEVDEEDPGAGSHSTTGEEDHVGEAAANAAAAFIRADRGKQRSSRRPNSVRRVRRASSAATRRNGKTTRMRRARRFKASAMHMRGSVMHDFLVKILAIGNRRNNKHSKRSADGPRSTSKDQVRSPASRMTPARGPSPERFTPKSCSRSTKTSSQEISNNGGHPRGHSGTAKDDKHFVSHRNSRGTSSSKSARGHPHNRRQTSQQRRAQKVNQSTSSDVPKRYPETKPVLGNYTTYSTLIPKRILRTINNSLAASIRGVASYHDPEYSTIETSCCTETDTSRTTPTESACRYNFDVVGEKDRADAIGKRGPSYIWVGGTILNKTDEDKFQEKQEGTMGFERHDQIQTAEECCNICPNILSSKIGNNEHLFIDHVICQPSSLIGSYPKGEPTQIQTKRTKKKVAPTDTRNTVENKGVRLSSTTKCLCRGVSLKNQNTSGNDIMRCLVQSSVRVQNAVFPHLNTAEHVSKTTQITPGDLVSILGSSVESNALGTIPSKNDFQVIRNNHEQLPLQENAISSTSHQKAKKTVRLKKKLDSLTKNRRPPKYKFVKRTTRNSSPKAPFISKGTPSTPESKKNEVVKEQPTARVTPKSPQKRNATKDFEAPNYSTCMPRLNRRPRKISRVYPNVEDNSRSELVSLFRADTRGSSIQSVEIGSSNSTYGVKPTILLEQGKQVSTPPKSCTQNMSPVKVPHARLDSQSKRVNAGITSVAKRTQRTTLKPPARARQKDLFTTPTASVLLELSPEQPRDEASTALSCEIQSDTVLKTPTIFTPKTSSQWSSRDLLTDSLRNRPSPSESAGTAYPIAPGGSESKTLHLKPLESTSRHSRSMSDSASKVFHSRQPRGLPSLPTSRRQSDAKQTSETSSSGLKATIVYSTPPIDLNISTLSPRSSHDTRKKIHTRRNSWQGRTKMTCELRGDIHSPTIQRIASSRFPKSHSLTKQNSQSLTSLRPLSPTFSKQLSSITLKTLSHRSFKSVCNTSSHSRQPSFQKILSHSTENAQNLSSPKSCSQTPSKLHSSSSPKPCSSLLKQFSQASSKLHSCKSCSRTSQNPTGPPSSKSRSPSQKQTSPTSKSRNHPSPKPYVLTLQKTLNTSPKPRTPTSSKPRTPMSPKALHFKVRGNSESKQPQEKPIEPIQSEYKSLVLRTAQHNNASNLSERPRKLFKKRRAPSPPVGKSCESSQTGRNLTLQRLQNDRDREHLTVNSDENSFHLLCDRSTCYEHRPEQNIPSHCFNKITYGFSRSSTSMTPAIGSYEHKFLSPGAWHKGNNHSLTNHSVDGIECKMLSSAEEYSENDENITSRGGGQTTQLSRNSEQKCEDADVQLDEAAPEDSNGNVRATTSTGVCCKTESRSATDRTTEQHNLSCGVVQKEEHQCDGHCVNEEFVEGSKESISNTILLQNNKSGHGTQYSAESMVLSVLERLSSKDATESYCQIFTQSDVASNQRQASRDISSLTDAISCISSIPEDTLPNIANSNSTTCEVLLEELSYDYPEKETEQPNPLDILNHRHCRKTSYPSLSHLKYSPEEPNHPLGSTDLKEFHEKPCDDYFIQLNSTQDIEPTKRSHGRPSAAMHVSWDTSLSKFCVHAKRCRCGVLRTEVTDMCQPIPTSWHDTKLKDDQFYATSHQYARCGRCATCLREKCFNKDRWSQSSPAISSSPYSHHVLYQDHSDKTSANSFQNNRGTTCTVAMMKTKEGELLCRTHQSSCSNFPRASLICPASAESWSVQQPYYTQPTISKTGANSSPIHNESMNDDSYWADSTNVVPSRLAVESLWPAVPTPETKSLVDTPAVNATKIKSSCRYHPHLTLSPVYTTSLPEEVVTEGAMRPFNKDIVLQRVADLLETHSSILSIDSDNKVLLKETDRAEETKPISKFRHKNNVGNQPMSAATSTDEPPDKELERIVAGIADRVTDFLRDMTLAVGEIQHRNQT